MWTHRVEVPPPRFDNHLGLAAAAEPLDAEAFVTELAVEGLVGAVLPRLAGIDDGGLNVRPVSHCRIAWLTNSGPLSERR